MATVEELREWADRAEIIKDELADFESVTVDASPQYERITVHIDKELSTGQLRTVTTVYNALVDETVGYDARVRTSDDEAFITLERDHDND